MNAYNPAIDIRNPDAPLTADEREAIRVLTTGVHAGEPWQAGYADAIMRRYEATTAALAKRVEELAAAIRCDQASIANLTSMVAARDARIEALTRALERAIRTIDMESDDAELIAELRAALSAPASPEIERGDSSAACIGGQARIDMTISPSPVTVAHDDVLRTTTVRLAGEEGR